MTIVYQFAEFLRVKVWHFDLVIPGAPSSLVSLGALCCPAQFFTPRSLSFRFLPHGLDWDASEIRQVRSPRTSQEVSTFQMATAVPPFEGSRLVVAVADPQIVGDGEPEDGEDQVASADGESILQPQATFSS